MDMIVCFGMRQRFGADGQGHWFHLRGGLNPGRVVLRGNGTLPGRKSGRGVRLPVKMYFLPIKKYRVL
jgi:hypothetical protein